MKPILFSAEMVRAILSGQKTMTRRVMKPQPAGNNRIPVPGKKRIVMNVEDVRIAELCPFGKIGQQLWVRETWMKCDTGGYEYRADYCKELEDGIKWNPSIFMPRDASRITLEITGVRVERLRDITDEDAIKEGVAHVVGRYPVEDFAELWDSINAKKPERSWDDNPFVWVIEFKVKGK